MRSPWVLQPPLRSVYFFSPCRCFFCAANTKTIRRANGTRRGIFFIGALGWLTPAGSDRFSFSSFSSANGWKNFEPPNEFFTSSRPRIAHHRAQSTHVLAAHRHCPRHDGDGNRLHHIGIFPHHQPQFRRQSLFRIDVGGALCWRHFGYAHRRRFVGPGTTRKHARIVISHTVERLRCRRRKIGGRARPSVLRFVGDAAGNVDFVFHRRRVRRRFYANGDRASQCAVFLLDARPADRGLHPTRVASRWRSCCDVRSLLHRPADNWFRAEACQHLTNFSGAHSGRRTYRGAWFGNWRRITTYFLVVTSRQPIDVVEFFHFGMPLFAQV